MKANHLNLWACTDCTLTHANGECDPDPDRKPWSLWTDGEVITMGLLTEEHADTCTPADREEGCDCERREFDTSPCGGCGSRLAGTRDAFTAWWD